MSEQFYTLITNIGKSKIANANVLGTKVAFTTLKVGDGNGRYYEPTEAQENLVNEVWQGGINSIRVDENNSNWIVIDTVIPSSVGGFTIREAGIFDDTGELLAIAKYPETYKPVAENGATKDLTIEMILEVTNAASVTLKVDPAVTLATQKDINGLQTEMKVLSGSTNEAVKKNAEVIETLDGKVSSHLAENATTTTKGHVQLGTTSTTAAVGNHNHSGVYEPTLTVERKRKITFGTVDPTGGVDGDIYLQYE